MGFETVYGVDFSGSSTAGEKIWITEADVSSDDFVVNSVQRIDDFLDLSSQSRDVVLRELLRDIQSRDDRTLFGFDFPFSLPEPILSQPDWEDFVTCFPDEFLSPENLQRVCSDRARLVGEESGVQLNRQTESDSGGLCPYNAQIRLQTYYGIRDLLRPLTLTESAQIAPMFSPPGTQPTVIEVYPAATIQQQTELTPRGYKSNTESAADKRDALLGEFLPEASEIEREHLVNDAEADGIDSLIAANAAFRNRGNLAIDETNDGTPVEGRIYV
ncbi:MULTISPECIES: DUF429 domain-containing protein [Halobacterium]|uniref:DUF429 domain-containing protein n=1 Tax=Halobacterium TaxID=2239 RepID=UPI00073EF05B|nr:MULTISPECIES: DUF429 domain-containing protein [Halobacterium]MCG1002210.1 DUF429 domain-containing protein [Halobacterium noricense]